MHHISSWSFNLNSLLNSINSQAHIWLGIDLRFVVPSTPSMYPLYHEVLHFTPPSMTTFEPPPPPPYLYLTTYLWFLSLITSQLPPSDTHTYLNPWTYLAFYLCLIIIRLLCVVSVYAPARGSRGGSLLADLKGINRTNSNIVIFNKKFLCVRMHAHISAI